MSPYPVIVAPVRTYLRPQPAFSTTASERLSYGGSSRLGCVTSLQYTFSIGVQDESHACYHLSFYDGQAWVAVILRTVTSATADGIPSVLRYGPLPALCSTTRQHRQQPGS
jgi:hypothetical protein